MLVTGRLFHIAFTDLITAATFLRLLRFLTDCRHSNTIHKSLLRLVPVPNKLASFAHQWFYLSVAIGLTLGEGTEHPGRTHRRT